MNILKSEKIIYDLIYLDIFIYMQIVIRSHFFIKPLIIPVLMSIVAFFICNLIFYLLELKIYDKTTRGDKMEKQKEILDKIDNALNCLENLKELYKKAGNDKAINSTIKSIELTKKIKEEYVNGL